MTMKTLLYAVLMMMMLAAGAVNARQLAQAGLTEGPGSSCNPNRDDCPAGQSCTLIGSGPQGQNNYACVEDVPVITCNPGIDDCPSGQSCTYVTSGPQTGGYKCVSS